MKYIDRSHSGHSCICWADLCHEELQCFRKIPRSITSLSSSDIQQISVGDNFYDSGVDFSTAGILRFQAAWADMYTQGVFKYAPW